MNNANAWIRWQLPLLSLLAVSVLAFFLNYETVSPRVTDRLEAMGVTVDVPQRLAWPEGQSFERLETLKTDMTQRLDVLKDTAGVSIGAVKTLLRLDRGIDMTANTNPIPVVQIEAAPIVAIEPESGSVADASGIFASQEVSAAAPASSVGTVSGGTLAGSYWSRITFYNCVGQGGGFCGRTASGATVTSGVAACGYAYTLGQVLRIQGDPTGHYYTCLDRGGGLNAYQVDVWIYSYAEGIAWQRVVGSYAWVELIN